MLTIKIFIFIFLVAFFQYPITSIADSNLSKAKYSHGFKLYQYKLEPGASVADNPIPMAELGAFVAKKSIFSYREVVKKSGIPLSSSRLYRAFGYLQVKKPGLYTIIVTSEGIKKYGCILIDRKVAISERNQPLTLAAPANFIEPGIYEIDMRVYDCINSDLTTSSSSGYVSRDEFKFLIKTPDSDDAQPAHKVLLLPIQ